MDAGPALLVLVLQNASALQLLEVIVTVATAQMAAVAIACMAVVVLLLTVVSGAEIALAVFGFASMTAVR